MVHSPLLKLFKLNVEVHVVRGNSVRNVVCVALFRGALRFLQGTIENVVNHHNTLHKQSIFGTRVVHAQVDIVESLFFGVRVHMLVKIMVMTVVMVMVFVRLVVDPFLKFTLKVWNVRSGTGEVVSESVCGRDRELRISFIEVGDPGICKLRDTVVRVLCGRCLEEAGRDAGEAVVAAVGVWARDDVRVRDARRWERDAGNCRVRTDMGSEGRAHKRDGREEGAKEVREVH